MKNPSGQTKMGSKKNTSRSNKGPLKQGKNNGGDINEEKLSQYNSNSCKKLII
jgi:hypothetical protein